MENKLFTIVNREDEDSFLTDLSNNPDNFNKKLVFVFGNSENYVVVNGEKFLHKPESAERAPVDLGLPSGTLWAAGNIGAELPWETGKYFAWGETTGYTDADVSAGVRAFNSGSYTASVISADLTLEQDAARANLGGNWQMPTADYYQELIDNCTYSYHSNYGGSGVACAVFKSMVNNNELVIPCTGYYNGTSNSSSGYVFCWSSSWSSSSKAKRGYGSTTFTATSTSNRYYGLNVRAIVPGARTLGSGTGTEKSYKYIDLGLPSGLLWATCNVGTRSPEQAGLYFAWGETTGYTAEQVTSGVRAFSKDVYNAGPAASISTDLTLEQDAAHVNLGGNWRMPTKDEYQELFDNCDVTWVSSYMGKGVAGRLYTSRVNGNSVFFPAAGSCFDSSVGDVGSYGYYLSASWDSSSYSWHLNFGSGNQSLNKYATRYWGYSVRGVLSFPSPPAESNPVDLGLPSGLKWAEGNVGATSAEQTGLYFAWGETTGYTGDQVKNGERSFSSSEYSSGPAASISADLTLAQDAARANLSGNWRMPTKAECQELIDNTTQTWTNDYNGTGVVGRVFTSKVNGNSVFFPATGYCRNSSVNGLGSSGRCWSASWDSSSNAWNLFFDSGKQAMSRYDRFYGYSVRGVCE